MTLTTHVHQHGNTRLHTRIAMPDAPRASNPLVMIAPDWSGTNAFADEVAIKLAGLGYIGMVCDVYGDGKVGSTNDEKSALMHPFMADRALLRERMLALLTCAQALEGTPTQSIAAIGFCFGGLCALDLARSGASIAAVASFHGLLGAPTCVSTQPIHAKILALHGHDDPMVTPQDVLAFETEMTRARTDWQLHVFGATMHAFTNPQANNPQFGTLYSPQARDRSWQIVEHFLAESL